MTTFEAKYASRCPDCTVGIEIGDEVVYVDDTVVHATCSEAAEQRVAAQDEGAVCTKCWMTRSVTGTCGCDPDD